MKPAKVEYVGKDLEAMDFAENYHRWILELFRPFIGKRLVEVGAGTGSFSKLLVETNPESLTLIEPSDMFEGLRESVPESSSIKHSQNIFTNVADDIGASAERPDTIFYVNVLEHIEDDGLELTTVNQTLAAGGHACIFVPALPSLYSDFDKRLGHYRRYAKEELLEKCVAAGFQIRLERYFDLVGVLPWFLKYRLMRSQTLGSGLVTLYDKAFVPVIKPIERLLRPPVGKNLLVVAQKI